MKLLSGLIGEIGGVVNTLSVSSKEKKRIEAELLQAVNKHEEEPGCHHPLGNTGQLAATFLASCGYVGICCYRAGRDFLGAAHPGGYLEVLGPAGNRYRRIRHWPECQKNYRSLERMRSSRF